MNGCTETDKPLISIVVPVHQSEDYLEQCVDSILRQTYNNCELILIDDGSTDRSGEICDKYARRDNRVLVYHQKNQGVSAARNYGVAVSHGRYIAFVDSDDWIEPEYIHYLFNLVSQHKCDAAAIALQSVRISAVNGILSGKEALEKMLYQKVFDTAPWGKLFYRDLVAMNPFPKGMFYEDLAVVCRIIVAAKKIAIGDKKLYHYRKTPTGTMQGGNVLRLLDEIVAADMMYAFVSKTEPDLQQAALCRKFSAYCQVLARLPNEGYSLEKNEVASFLLKSRWAVLVDRKARLKNKIAAVALCFGVSFFRVLWRKQLK